MVIVTVGNELVSWGAQNVIIHLLVAGVEAILYNVKGNEL